MSADITKCPRCGFEDLARDYTGMPMCIEIDGGCGWDGSMLTEEEWTKWVGRDHTPGVPADPTEPTTTEPSITHEEIEAAVAVLRRMSVNETAAWNMWNNIASDSGGLRHALEKVWAARAVGKNGDEA
jgi:hypothetical protein